MNTIAHAGISIYRSSRAEVFYKKVFLEILENSQENTCARASFFNKVEGLWRLLFKNVFQSATSFARFMSD